GLKEPVKEKIRSDLTSLLSLKQELEPGADRVEPWDLAFLTEQERKRKFALDNEEIRKYFPFDLVLQGMFELFGPLLGVRFSGVPKTPVWAPGVRLIRISDQNNDRTIAYIYLDMFPRDGKYGYMMMSPLIAGRARDGGYTVPVTAIVGNFRAPSENIPSLLTHDDVEGLFHELGHALHGCLTKAPYASLAGSSVEWDFVETPSQALENWAWEPVVLDAISGHYANPGEKLPAPLRDRIIAATGAAYRHWILGQGNMQDGKALLIGFLGKEPGMDVFYERLNIRLPHPGTPP